MRHVVKPKNYLLPLLLVALPFAPADAQVIDRFSDLRRQTEALEKRPDKSERNTTELQCMQVVGMRSFCSCVSEQLPEGLTFEQYVVVLSRSKKDNGYDGLRAAAKRTYDSVPVIRDACARASSEAL